MYHFLKHFFPWSAALLSIATASAQWNPTSGPVAHDVEGQLTALDVQASCLAFWRGGFPLPGPLLDHRTRHYQGIARHPDPEARVMYVTLSEAEDSERPGYIGAVLIDSADSHPGSARLRSNRLLADTELASSAPYQSDRVVWSYPTGGHVHPSGIQAAGRYLAVPLSGEYGGNRKKIVFFDISNATAPVLLPTIIGDVAGDLAFLHLPDGRYLLYTNHTWYRTTGADISTLSEIGKNQRPLEWPGGLENFCDGTVTGRNCDGNLSVPDGLPFIFVPDFTGYKGPGLKDGDFFKGFQSMALVQDARSIYLIGMVNRHGLAPVLRADDVLAIYEVRIPPGNGSELNIELFYRGAKTVDTHGDWKIGGKDAWSGNFNAGGTVYVSPEGELLVYAIEHYDVGYENANVQDSPLFNQPYSPFSEFHHPRFTPPSRPPVTASTAYVALYSEANFKGFRVELDFPDLAFETWDDFNDLPGPCRGSACDFNDEVSSVFWSLPPGMTVRLFSNDSGQGDSLTLTGSGSIANLHVSHGSIADKASSLTVDYPGLTNLYVSKNDSRRGGTVDNFFAADFLLKTKGGNSHTRIKLDSDTWSFTGTLSDKVTIRSLGGPSTLGK